MTMSHHGSCPKSRASGVRRAGITVHRRHAPSRSIRHAVDATRRRAPRSRRTVEPAELAGSHTTPSAIVADASRQGDRPGVGGDRHRRRRRRRRAGRAVAARDPGDRRPGGRRQVRLAVDQRGRRRSAAARSPARPGAGRAERAAPAAVRRRLPARSPSQRPSSRSSRPHLGRCGTRAAGPAPRRCRPAPGRRSSRPVTSSTVSNGRRRPSQLTNVPAFSATGATGRTTSARSVTALSADLEADQERHGVERGQRPPPGRAGRRGRRRRPPAPRGRRPRPRRGWRRCRGRRSTGRPVDAPGGGELDAGRRRRRPDGRRAAGSAGSRRRARRARRPAAGPRRAGRRCAASSAAARQRTRGRWPAARRPDDQPAAGDAQRGRSGRTASPSQPGPRPRRRARPAAGCRRASSRPRGRVRRDRVDPGAVLADALRSRRKTIGDSSSGSKPTSTTASACSRSA